MPSFSRSYSSAAVFYAILAIVCSRFPLVNYLGYEFSAVTAVVAGFVSGLLLLHALHTESPSSPGAYWRMLGRGTGRILILGLLPGLLMFANALLVRNCSLTEGMAWYAVLVIPSLVFSAGLAAFVGVLVNRWRKTAYTVVFLLLLAHIVVVGLIGPQIFAFNPLIGYFPGLTYDESLDVLSRVALYRVTTVAAAAVLFAMSAILSRIRFRGLHESAHHGPFIAPEWFVVAALVPACVVVFVLSDRLGFSSSEEFIRRKLGGTYRRGMVEYVYPASKVTHAQIERIGMTQEYALDRMRRLMGPGSGGGITVFIYATPEQKGRLIGARQTDISKPWLGQVHINAADVGQVLTHELAHVRAAEFGFSPLRVGRSTGLIEGFAVAMEGKAYDEPLSRAAAEVLSVNGAVDLESLFTFSGFATASPSVAYTLAGAFCRNLIDRFGAPAFRDVYRTGDFRSATGKPLPVLLAEWRASVDSVVVDSNAREKARYLFRRPSIFMKECARVIARRNEETARLLEEHDFEAALASAEASLALSRSTDAIFLRVRALMFLRRYDEVVRTATGLLSDTTIAGALVPLRFRLGDAYWSLGRTDSADAEFTRLHALHLSASYDEACAVRLGAMRSGDAGGTLWKVLTLDPPDSVRRGLLKSSPLPLALYLAGQDALLQERFADAINILTAAGALDDRELEYHRLRRIGRALFELEAYDRAAAFFRAAKALVPAERSLDSDEWIERCAWVRR